MSRVTAKKQNIRAPLPAVTADGERAQSPRLLCTRELRRIRGEHGKRKREANELAVANEKARHTGDEEAKTLPPWDSFNSRLIRETYRLVRHLKAAGCDNVIEVLVREANLVPTSPSFADNPFHWALLAMQGKKGEFIGRPDRRKFANQMRFAHAHSVPERYLIGFLMQLAKKPDIHKKVNALVTGKRVRICEWPDSLL